MDNLTSKKLGELPAAIRYVAEGIIGRIKRLTELNREMPDGDDKKNIAGYISGLLMALEETGLSEAECIAIFMEACGEEGGHDASSLKGQANG